MMIIGGSLTNHVRSRLRPLGRMQSCERRSERGGVRDFYLTWSLPCVTGGVLVVCLDPFLLVYLEI